MSASHPYELEIIQAFSTVTVPERILRDSNVKELIRSMVDEQDKVQNNARNLEKARQDKKDGNFFGNLTNGRADKVQEAQLDLSASIGQLTQKSSQLLVVNTAISKVLSDQQNILLKQQTLLKQQASDLKDQNQTILAQQLQLSEQQKAINAANEGLLTAKGVTQEQAQKLVGCVVRVTEAEQKIDVANAEVLAAVEQRLTTAWTHYADRYASLNDQVASQLDAHLGTMQGWLGDATTAVGRDVAAGLTRIEGQVGAQLAAAAHTQRDALQAHELTVDAKLAPLDAAQTANRAALDTLGAQMAQLAHLQQEGQQTARRHRLIIGVVGALAVLSLGWQLAAHLA